MSSVISDKHYQNEAAAYAWVEARVWPEGPVCPHCGNCDAQRITKMQGKTTRPGLYNCKECRKPFTVKIGTVFEASHVPMHLWLQAMFLMVSSKKGISSNQLHRTLGVTLKTAWFMSHRLREAIRIVGVVPMGGKGEIVEIDETIIGKQEGAPKNASFKGSNFRNVVLTLVERGGSARSFHVDGVSIADLKPIIHANLAKEAQIMTDERNSYGEIGEAFASHDTVNHSIDEYVRWEGTKLVSTNTIEGYYSIFKRGMKGVYQHCKEKHLHRYLSEFDFRYSNRARLGVDDVQRTELAIKGIVGKRLTYRAAGH